MRRITTLELCCLNVPIKTKFFIINKTSEIEETKQKTGN